MLTTSAMAETAFLVGDPARANMLAALMDGRALTATELARVASIAPQTASGHLAQLARGGLVEVARQGRHRYHRLASPSVAQMLETIMSVAATASGGTPRRPAAPVGPRDRALRRARTCYDHLAGELAVAIADRMKERGQLELSGEGAALTESGADFLQRLGVNLEPAQLTRNRRARVLCRPCLDWSERRLHIAGAVGAALCECWLRLGWIRRMDGTRAVAVTQAGEIAFAREFRVRLEPQAG